MLATNITYDNTNSGITSTNVQGAIDELYTKANTTYDEYSGVTTYTPSSSIQTIPTNNKLMKSDITINSIPSSYKNLSTTTTAISQDLLSGKTAYNNLGELITGGISTDCINGNFKVTQDLINNGKTMASFNPSSFIFLSYRTDNRIVLHYYDKKIDANNYYSFRLTLDGSYYSNNAVDSIASSNYTLVSPFVIGFNSDMLNKDYYYYICK